MQAAVDQIVEFFHFRSGVAEEPLTIASAQCFRFQRRVFELFQILIISGALKPEQFSEAAEVNPSDPVAPEIRRLSGKKFRGGFRRKAFGMVIPPVVKIGCEAVFDRMPFPAFPDFRGIRSQFDYDVIGKFAERLGRCPGRAVGNDMNQLSGTVLCEAFRHFRVHDPEFFAP